MNAKQAREKAESAIKSGPNSQFIEIKLRINSAANNGEYSIFVYEPIREEVRKLLIDDGFEIGITHFIRNEYLTKISW